MKSTIKEAVLSYDIVAQVNKVRDISVPLRNMQEEDQDEDDQEATQMTQLKFAAGHGIEDKNKKEEANKAHRPKRRTLLLSLSDGESQFHALEDRLVPQIKPDHFKIGSKVLFKKGALVKRERIILSLQHFAVIGHPLSDLPTAQPQEQQKGEPQRDEELLLQDMPPDLFEEQTPQPLNQPRFDIFRGYERREQWDYGRAQSRATLEEYFESTLFLNRDD